MQNNKHQLNEGLRPLDLEEMVHTIFEVDSFKSKMGEDKDVCVVSFKVKDRSPAKDLMEFIEKGYPFVLDADVSSGEDNSGEYSVFVEISRTPDIVEQIKNLTYGVQKLTGIKDFKFRYYKEDQIHEASGDNLSRVIPPTPKEYEGFLNRVQTENVKKFFSKTLMDDLTLEGSTITIHKPFNGRIQLEIVKDDTPESILEGLTDSLTIDEKSMSEIFWLTKVLGDYGINKAGENFVFTNGSRSMLLKRKE